MSSQVCIKAIVDLQVKTLIPKNPHRSYQVDIEFTPFRIQMNTAPGLVVFLMGVNRFKKVVSRRIWFVFGGLCFQLPYLAKETGDVRGVNFEDFTEQPVKLESA